MSPLDLNDIAMFVRVVELSAFAKAGRELGVPTSTVSRAVARLEEALGTQLVQRNTRSVVPTAEGRAFFSDVQPGVLSLQHAARRVEGADRAPRGRLRVSVLNDLGTVFVSRVVAAFAARYPHIALDVELSMRTVRLVEDGFDVAIRASRKLPDSSLVARKVGDLESLIVASPAYLAARGSPRTLDEIAQHECFLFRGKDGEAEWALEGPEGAVNLRVEGRLSADEYNFVRAAVVDGAGIALIPRILAAADLTAGRLVHVLPEYSVGGGALYVIYAAAAKTPNRIAVFRDFVIEAYAKLETNSVRSHS